MRSTLLTEGLLSPTLLTDVIALRPTVAFLRPSKGVYLIDGKRLESELIGLYVAWLAIRSASSNRPGPTVESILPRAAYADVSLRASMKRAAKVLEAYSKPLASVVRTLSIKAGRVKCPPARRVDVVCK